MKLRVEKPIYGGAGLARSDGKAVFVPFALPEETVEARTVQDHGSYADAELEQVLEASPQRTQPPCPYFGECGGCHYQHASYQAQAEMKTRILRESLERARIAELPEIEAVCGEPWAYRNRIRLHVDRTTSKLCYKRRASRENLAVEECPIAAPVLQETRQSIQSVASEWRLGGRFTEMELFANAAQDAMLLTLWSEAQERAAGEALQLLWPQIHNFLPKIVGAAVFTAENGRRQSKLAAQVGEQFLMYTVAGRDYRVSAGSFFQVNRYLLDRLVSLVADARAGRLAWDLYAGVGLFSSALAERFEQVLAVESAPNAVRDLRRNLKGKAHRVLNASTLDFLRRKGGGAAPDFVVVDPPRAGLGKEASTLLATARPARITYVSCDPATLSRDLKSLLDSGYHLDAMRMVDLFPQTFHLESVAELSLK